MSTKDKSTAAEVFDQEVLRAMGAGAGTGGSGNNGNGVGGGGGSPGGDKPGGGNGNGNGGGKPGDETFGNNLSFPAIFFESAPELRGDDESFTFTTPAITDLGEEGYVYFAQRVEGNTWQAGSITAPGGQSVRVDHIDIGDALESAPLKTGTNVRLELTLYQDILNPDFGEPGAPGDTLTAFAMTLLGGAKGDGKPTVKGATESQGARLLEGEWDDGLAYEGITATAPDGTTYESELASIYAAESTGGETTDSYMSMSIQKVTGLASIEDGFTGLAWDGLEWVDTDSGDGVTVGANIMNTAFGPELNIGGKYIMGASGKPFKFTGDGDYLITFALEDGTPVSFDEHTTVSNDGLAEVLGFQPVDVEGRHTEVIADGDMSYGMGGADTHNGLAVMLVGIPSSVPEGGEDVA